MGAVRHKTPTLCFKCNTPSPICPWKYNFTPVEGWDAEPTKVAISGNDSRMVNSYVVKSCPLYEENERKPEEKIELPKSKYKIIDEIMKAKRRKERKLGD